MSENTTPETIALPKKSFLNKTNAVRVAVAATAVAVVVVVIVVLKKDVNIETEMAVVEAALES